MQNALKHPFFRHKATLQLLPWVKARTIATLGSVYYRQSSSCGLWLPSRCIKTFKSPRLHGFSPVMFIQNQHFVEASFLSWPESCRRRHRSYKEIEEVVEKLCQEGRLKDALHFLEATVHTTTKKPPKKAYIYLLKVCIKRKALTGGRQIHALMVQNKCDSDVFLANNLIDMYFKCGSLLDARLVFNAMPQRNVISWTAIISAYVDSGKYEDAINLFKGMQDADVVLDKVAFVVALKACTRIASLEQGKVIHSLVLKMGLERDIMLQNLLIDMYAKCGCLEYAHKLFYHMSERNVISWTAMIAGYAQNGLGKEALALYGEMKQEGVQANKATYVCVLKACANIGALEQGKQIHSLILEKGLDMDVIIQSTLVDMYAKCGCLQYARELFNNMSQRNVISWTAMIAGYAQNGLGKEALALYEQMMQEGIQANKVTFVCVLKACADIGALEQGKLIHSLILEKSFHLDVMVQNSLIDMYAKCGCLEDARELFNKMSERDVVSWNAMIAGYAQNGFGKEAIALYEQMKQEAMQEDKTTFICVLKACGNIRALHQGKQIHSLILEKGFDLDVIVQSTLVDMYAKCGCLEDARKLFNNMSERNVVSWNAMIAGYAQNGLGKEALALYEGMKQEGMLADKVTFLSLLKACANIGALKQGKKTYALILENGFDLDVILQSTLVDMYAKCGCLEDACELFNNMSKRDVVSWTAIIAGFAQNGFGKEALDLYEQMKEESLQSNKATFVCVLNACANIGALEHGKQIHSIIAEKGFDLDVLVQSTLVDMYIKCGCLEEACEIFNNMSERNVVSWNAIIAGYAQNGLGKGALALFEEMKQEGMHPDDVTYTSVLSACSHSGLVEEGFCVFDFLYKSNGVRPTPMHYACMVDLLGRAGLLAEAEDFIMKMPFQPHTVVWMTLLGAARNAGTAEIGQYAFDHIYNEVGSPNITPLSAANTHLCSSWSDG